MMPWPGILVIIAALTALGCWFKRRLIRVLDFFSLLLFLPLLASFFVPFTGRVGLAPLAAAVAPAVLILALLICQDGLILARSTFGIPDKQWKGWSLTALAGSFFFLVIALQGLALSNLQRGRLLLDGQEKHNRVLDVLVRGSGTLITDQPGWLAWSQDEKVVDALGHYSIRVASRMEASGDMSSTSWSDIVKHEGVQSWVIWSEEFADMLRGADIVNLPRGEEAPRVMLRGRPASL